MSARFYERTLFSSARFFDRKLEIQVHYVVKWDFLGDFSNDCELSFLSENFQFSGVSKMSRQIYQFSTGKIDDNLQSFSQG